MECKGGIYHLVQVFFLQHSQLFVSHIVANNWSFSLSIFLSVFPFGRHQRLFKISSCFLSFNMGVATEGICRDFNVAVELLHIQK